MIIKILIIIGIILLSSEILGALAFLQDINNFCQENGFDYSENYENSHACWKDTPEKTIVKKAKCGIDFVSLFTFRNPFTGCKFLKEIEVIN